MPASDVNDIRQYLSESGCPVCARLQECRRDLPGGNVTCNASGRCKFHAWALAKSASETSASGVFRSASHQAVRNEGADAFCARLNEMESQSLAVLKRFLTQPKVKEERMRRYGRLCLAHALGPEAPEADSYGIAGRLANLHEGALAA